MLLALFLVFRSVGFHTKIEIRPTQRAKNSKQQYRKRQKRIVFMVIFAQINLQIEYRS